MLATGLALVGAFVHAETHLIFSAINDDADPGYVDAGLLINSPAPGASEKISRDQHAYEMQIGQAVFQAQSWTGTAEGTAFLVSPDLVVTNHHVMAGHDDCGKFEVTLTTFAEKVACKQVELCDSETDFCVVRMNSLQSGHPIGAHVIPLKFTTQVEQGPNVLSFIVGNALASGIQAASYEGIKVSGTTIGHCVRAWPGNSGSPLLNTSGEVLGIHFGRGSFSNYSCPEDRELGMAVSAKHIFDALTEAGKADIAAEIRNAAASYGTSGSGPSAP